MRNLLALFMLAGVAAGCSKSDNNDNNPNGEPNNSSATIGPGGGEVSASGASVAIPENALADEVEIGVARLSSSAASSLAATLDANLELVSDLYAFTPHGTSFAEAVDIELPYSSSSDGLVVVRLDDEDDTTWEQVSGASFGSGVASLSTNSFSVLGVAAPTSVVANNDAGPNNGNDTGGGDMGGSDMGSGGDMGGGDMGATSDYANLPGSWTVTQDIGGSSTYNPAIAVNASGDAIVAWHFGNDDLLFISERTGGTWAHPADATDGLAFANTSDSWGEPFAGIADNGDAVIVFSGRVSTGSAVFRSTRVQGVWNHPNDATDRIDFPTETDSHFGLAARVAMAPDGSGIATWLYLYTGLFGSLGSGGTWSQPTDVVNDALNVGGNWGTPTGYNAVDIVNGGRAIVAHHQEEATGNFLTIAMRDGANWARGEQITTVAATRNQHPWAAMAPNGDAVAMFTNQAVWDGCQSCTAFYVSEYTGGAWTHPADADDYLNAGGPGLNQVTADRDEVTLAMTDSGDVVVVYQQYYNGNQQVYVAERIGGVWDIPSADEFVPFTYTSPSPVQMAAAVGPTGDIAIVRNSDQDGVYRTTDLAHRIDGTWYVPGPGDKVRLSMNGWQWPSIEMGAGGHVVVGVKANNDTVTIAEFSPN